MRCAPQVWQRLGTNTPYVLMYDIFGIRPNNFGFSETKDFKTFKDLGRFNEEGVMKATNFSQPKHGAIMPITEAEATALCNHWGLDYSSLKRPW